MHPAGGVMTVDPKVFAEQNPVGSAVLWSVSGRISVC